jgi:hypothetical protein
MGPKGRGAVRLLQGGGACSLINLRYIRKLAAASKKSLRMKKGQEMRSAASEHVSNLKNVLTPPQGSTYQRMKSQSNRSGGVAPVK